MSRSRLVLLAALALASPAWPEPPKPDGWVVLPVADYRALREKANPLPPELEPPPADAALSRLDYELRVEGDAALGEIRGAIDVLGEGFVRVPMPPGLVVREARLGERAVALLDGGPAPKGGGGPAIVLAKPGHHSLTLDVVVPVVSSAGAESLSLPAGNAPVSRVAVSLPRNGLDVTVAGGLLVESQEAGERTRVVAHASPGQALSITWRRRTEDRRAELPVRIRGSVTAIVGLAEDAAQVSAQVRLEVVQGLVRGAEVALPEGFAVNQVSGALVADWEATPGRLAISLIEPADGVVAFIVTGESRAPRDGQVSIPLLRLSGAERETGGTAVEVLGAGEITQHQARGLDPSDPSDLGEAVAGRDSPSLVAFRYRPLEGTAPRSLGVSVARYASQEILVANVEEARYRALLTEEGKLLVEARWALRNRERRFVGVKLPEGAILWSAVVAGRPVRPGLSADGALLLPVARSSSADAFAVEVVYLDKRTPWGAKDRARLTMPALDLPVSKTGLVLQYPPRYRVDAQPGPLRLAAYEPPSSSALSGPVARAAPPPRLAEAKGKSVSAEDRAKDELQGLVDRFQSEGRGRRTAGALPVRVTVPSFGPVLFLVSELTAEGQAPALELSYERRTK
jgi:hypothetical protein